jgi:hypothetical protein
MLMLDGGVRRASDTVRVTARFKQIRTEGTERFAVYELACTDGAAASKSEVRWSDLARLHEELMHTQSATMLANKAVGLIPPFYQHLRSRIGSARFSSRFCESRAQAMTTLLVSLVRVFDVSVAQPTGPPCLVVFLTRGADVAQTTPADRWFTAEHGWPQAVLDDCKLAVAPRALTPTAGEAPWLHPPQSAVAGELCVEVLEASGLKRCSKTQTSRRTPTQVACSSPHTWQSIACTAPRSGTS